MNTLILIRCLMCWMYILHGSFTSAVLNSPCVPGPLGMQDGRIRREHISATGIRWNDPELDKIRYNCCKDAKPDDSGLCLIHTPGRSMSVEVTFVRRVQISEVKLQCPSNCSIHVGYVKKYKLRYHDYDGAIKSYGTATAFNGIEDPRYSDQKEVRLPLTTKTFMTKIFVDITDFEKRPCLRLEFSGCYEAEVCKTPCNNGGKCKDTEYCECRPNYGPPDKQCKYHFPNMTYSPTIEVGDAGQGDNTVTLSCTIPTSRAGIKHIAYWFVDLGENGMEWLYNGTFTSSRVVSKINQRDIYDRLYKLESGKRIKELNWELKCNVTACYHNEHDCSFPAAGSPPKSSQGISAKATLERTTIEVVEGEAGKTVGVKLHGPPVLFFLSDAKYGSSAVIEAVFDASFANSTPCTSSGTYPVVQHAYTYDKTLKHCGPNVTSANWHTTHKITIKAVTDRLITAQDVIRRCTINLKLVDSSGKEVASRIKLGALTVTVRNVDSWKEYWNKPSQCKSYTDPHIRTFDNTRFLLPFEGEYVLYRNKNHGYQVNIILIDCGRMTWHERIHVGVSCTCGAAIKVGDDVIILGNCPTGSVTTVPDKEPQGKRNYIFQVSMFLNGDPNQDKMKQLTEGTRIYTDDPYGAHYYVYLPTGTYVHVYPNWEFNTSFIDVAINPSLSDREHSDGICGFYDGRCIGDLRDANNVTYNDAHCGKVHVSKTGYDEFVNKWKVNDPCLSLLNGTRVETSSPVPIYCRCVLGSDTHDCGQNKDTEPCPPKAYKDITEYVVKERSFPPKPCQQNVGIVKRSLDGLLQLSKRSVPVIDSDEDVYQSVVFNKSYVPRNPTWPTPSGWTEANATGYCKDFLNKASVQNCKTFMNTSFEDEVNSCVFDIKVSDSTVFARAVLKSILGECLSEALKYPTDVTELPGNITRVVLYDSLCLDNCSNKGVCKNGQCECHPGFYGSVCALTKDIPPTITYLSRNGLCNIRSRNCTKSEIFGSGHIRSGDLKCRVTPYEPVNGVRDDKNQFTTSAMYIDFNMLVCPHKNKTGTFMVAVSNDNGKTYSKNELLFLAYDSVCFKCSIDQNKKRGNCTQLEATCVIEGGCFLAGALHSEDECKICDPGRDLKRWSVNSVLSKCIKTATPPIDNSLAIIVGIVAGIVVIATAIIAVMIYKLCTWKKMIHPSKDDFDDMQ